MRATSLAKASEVRGPLATIQIALNLDRIGRSARRREDDIHAYSTRLEALATSPLDFIAEIDESGRVTYASSGAAVAAGRPLDALIGRNVLEFLDPDGDSTLRQVLASKGRITPADVEAAAGTSHLAILPDGERRWYEFLGTSYRTLSGELRNLTSVTWLPISL